MALDTLTAKANTGSGTDQLAGVNTPSGFAGAVAAINQAGVQVNPATDETVQALSSLQAEVRALNDTMLYFVTAILEKMPMLNTNDQAIVSVASGTLTTVTNLTTLSTATTLQNFAGGNLALIPYQLGGMQPYISNNIMVS